jgi:hypothetical protein
MKPYAYALVVLALTALAIYAIKSYNEALDDARAQGFAQCDLAHQEADNQALAAALTELEELNRKYLDADRRADERQGVLNERVTKIRAVDWSAVVIPNAVDRVLAEDDNEIRLHQTRSENL